MNRPLLLALITLTLGGFCFSQAGSTNARKTNTAKTASKNESPDSARHYEDQLKQLQKAFASFQRTVAESQQKTEQQIQSLQQENAKLAEQLKQSEQTSASAQASAARSQEKIAVAEEQKPVVARLQSEMAAVKAAVTVTAEAIQRGDKRIEDLEQPATIHYRGVKLTPGGYMQFAQIYRTHNANSDTADSYGAFPLSGSANSRTSEFRTSGRASRLLLRVDSATKKMKMMGYVEVDFLGATPTSNESQTNSFNPRLRLAFGEIKFGNGWTIAGGQNWSMLQTTRKGIDSLSEWLPALIDNSYTTGFSYARQGTFRVTKELVPKKAWLGLSVENPETVANVQCLYIPTSTASVRSSCTSSILGGAIQGTENTSLTGSPSNGFSTAAGTSSSLLSSPSNDIVPDMVLKFAVEPGWGHYEVKAIGRFFHDRVYPQYLNGSSVANANNRTTQGGGIGVGAILPVVANKVDIDFQALAGKGIGRFGTTGGPDVTVNTKGDLIPIKGLQAILGVETHLTSKVDLNIYAGDEYYGRTTYSSNTGLFGSTQAGAYVIGYGAPQFVDNACAETTVSPSLCMSSSQNRNVWTVQPSMWYRLFRGKQGTVQLGASYSYTYRRTWDGVLNNTNSNNVISLRPLAIENIVMTSFRYYLP